MYVKWSAIYLIDLFSSCFDVEKLLKYFYLQYSLPVLDFISLKHVKHVLNLYFLGLWYWLLIWL